jgi:predicted GTPase
MPARLKEPRAHRVLSYEEFKAQQPESQQSEIYDPKLENLKTALQSATVIFCGQSFYVAFLGEQGIGKSSIINAIFDRELVNVPSLSSTCTAYSTTIT